MTCQSFRAAVICALLVPFPLAAQTTSPPRAQEPLPPVEAPATQPTVERQDEIAREQRYAWPVVSIFQGHTVRADERVRDLTVIMGDGVIDGRVENDVLVVLGDQTDRQGGGSDLQTADPQGRQADDRRTRCTDRGGQEDDATHARQSLVNR